MWRKTVYYLDRAPKIDLRRLFYAERQKLFVSGKVIDREFTVFTPNLVVFYDHLINDYESLLSSWSPSEERDAYNLYLQECILARTIEIADEGTETPQFGLPEFFVKFERPQTRHYVMAHKLADWTRGIKRHYVEYINRDLYPPMRDDFRIVIDVQPLTGFTFYFNDGHLMKAVNDYIEFNKTRHPFL